MKQLRLCTLAVAALAVMGSAQALTPSQIITKRAAGTLVEVDMSGASAIRLSIGGAFMENCDVTTTDVIWNSTTGSNHRAYSCTLATAVGNYPVGTDIVVYKRDSGGSTNGIRPVSDSVAIEAMVINGLSGTDVGGTCTASGTTRPSNKDVNTASYICPAVANRVPAIGFSDEEPALLNTGVNLSGTAGNLALLNSKPLTIGIFGVVANTYLRNLLQTAQAGTILPAACSAGDESDACVPSIPKGFATAVFASGGGFSPTTGLGWQQLGLTGTDATKPVYVQRRAAGSGTQAASNAYFLNGNCGSGAIAAAGASTSTTVRNVTIAGSSGAVTGSFAAANTNARLQLAVLGRENNPLPNGAVAGTAQDLGFRFLRINGVLPNRAAAKTGAYDFIYENTIQWRLADDAGNFGQFGAALLKQIPTAASLALSDADTQEALLSPTRVWGSVATPDPTNTFHSRVARVDGNSCTPVTFSQ